MFALTRSLCLAEADPPESRNTDIETSPSHFAAAIGSRRSLLAARSTRKLRLQPRARPVSSAIPSRMERWRPCEGAPKPGIDRGVVDGAAACSPLSPWGRGRNARVIITHSFVIAGLDPAIHSIGLSQLKGRGMDARIKSGHDEREVSGTGGACSD
jgi:hypothetical protein